MARCEMASNNRPRIRGGGTPNDSVQFVNWHTELCLESENPVFTLGGMVDQTGLTCGHVRELQSVHFSRASLTLIHRKCRSSAMENIDDEETEADHDRLAGLEPTPTRKPTSCLGFPLNHASPAPVLWPKAPS